ncbi:MAG: hypothetical protein ACI3YK_08065 [Eubacteriales bacterium]
MKKCGKLFTLLLAGCVLFGALTACGGSDDVPSDEDSGSTKTSKTTVSESNPESDPDPDHTHLWSEWEVTKEATCAEEGILSRSCECGETETQPIAKLEHTAGDWQTVTPATPEAPGKEVLLCSVCGAEMDSREILMDLEGFYHADSAGYYRGFVSIGMKTDYVIFNTNKEVVYTFATDENPEVYGGGYFLSKQGDTEYLKKADGTVICSTESLGISGFGLNGNYTANVSFLTDGYVLAYKVNETYAGVTYEIGILGVDGKWIVPLSADHPILSSGMNCSASAFQEKLRYMGEGILLVPVQINGYSYDYVLYSIGDNEVCRFTVDSYARNLDYIMTVTTFEDGVIYRTYGSTMYEIHKDGKVKLTDLFPDGTYNFGIFGYHVDKDGSYIVLSGNGWNMELRRNGTLIKSFEDVNITNAVYVGDVWLIYIVNSEGTRYYTYLKPDGEFLFEPIKTEASYICTEEGIGISYDDDKVGQADGMKIVIDREGKVLYQSEQLTTDLSIKNGIICETDESAFGSASFEKYTLLTQ